MKPLPRPFLLTLCGLVAVWLILFLYSSRPDSSSAPTKSTSHSSRNADPSSAPVTPRSTPATLAAQNPPPTAPIPAAVAPVQPSIDHPLLPAIQRVIAEQWTDAPQKLAARRRTRIVEANFKYPLLRLEETVTTDPATGLEKPTLLRASVADHLMIGLKPGVTTAQATAALLEKGYTIRAVEEGSFLLAQLPQHLDPADQTQAAQDIAALEEFIDHAEPDYLVFPCLLPNDPAYTQGRLWGLHNPGTAAGTKADADIDAPEAWDIRTNASSIIVAVTDTGIQYNHQDLLPNMWTHPTNGTYGFDAYDDDNDPMDIGGHGTHCAGTIGARGNNAIGMTGVAWQVKLMGVRFLGPNGGSTSDSIRAVNYARQNGAHIISASWGGGGYSQSLYNAIKACGDAGIPFIAAAGNSSANNDSTPHYPSSYDLDTIVSVASTTAADALSPFSCYGRNSVDIGAPGSDIWSAYIGSNTAYKSLNGTSMATPHVSGALALAMAHFPTENTPALLRRLYTSVDKISALNGKCKTAGRLNLAKLLGTTATPPLESDTFATAHRFEGHYGEWFGTNQEATSEPGESNTKTHWFAFRPAHAGLVTLDFTSDVLWYAVVIYEGSEKATLKPRQVSDIFGGNVRKFTLTPKADTEYRIMLATDYQAKQSFLVTYALTPINDMFADATAVNGELFSVNGYNRSATAEPFEKKQPHAKGGQGKSVWWRWTAPADMNVTLNTRGSAFDTIMAVYTGSTPDALTEIAANDDRNALDWTSQVQFAATAGTTYHIAVDSYRADAAGDITLNAFRSGTLNILRHPAPLAVELGKRAVFEVSALSNTDITYQWFLNGHAIPGQTASNIVIDPVRTIDLGNYHVQIATAENTLTSNPAALTEKQIPPRLTWSSGNQSVASGTAVSLSANFSGSTPLTFSWTKNGQPYTGSTSTLTFPSAQVADAGAYRLTATNAAGTATADFTFSVIQSPWDRWEWRRPGIPNAAITDIKVYDGEAFAVAGTTLLRSSDGVNWTKSYFPEGFTANAIAKSGNLLLCNGTNISNQFRVATSNNNGGTWTISTTTGLNSFGPETYFIIVHGGAFITSSQNGEDHFRSTNGITWARLTTTNLSGSNVNLTGNGRIATDGTQLIMASKANGTNGQVRFHKSTNGINWSEHQTQATVSSAFSSPAQAAAYGLGSFYLFESNTIFSSSDGATWQSTTSLSNGFSNTSMFASTLDTLMSFFRNTQNVRYFSNVADRKIRNILPADSHPFTAVASFGNKVIFGTQKGLLSTIQSPFDIRIPRDPSSTLDSLEFTENLIIARTTLPLGSASVRDLVSGDGVTWKLNTPMDTPRVVRVGSAFGKYYGYSSSGSAIQSGHNPFDIRPNPSDDIGLTPNVTFMGQLPNGNALAVTTPSFGSSTLRARTSGASSWTTVSFPQTIQSTSRFFSLGNRWYSSPESHVSSPAAILTSTNGSSWANSGLTGSFPQFLTMGGKSWCIYHASTGSYTATVATSTDGTSWTNLPAPIGLAPHSNSRFVKRVVAFGDYLVLLGTDEFLYYSLDGIAWVRGFTPGKVVDVVSGSGQLVAVMKNGGLIQTGTPHPGRNAPLVSIASPQTGSTHLIGSRVTIEGSAADPDDGAVSYECYLDSLLVASGTGDSFRFHVTITNPNGHTVTVRASDSHGLRQIDSIRLKVAAAEPENLLNNVQNGSVPGNHVVNFDGVFYAAGTRSIHRSIDGKTWEQVPIPSFANPIYAMASGNGALVIQFDNGGIMTTRDGVNWTHFQPNFTSYWVREPVRFSSGMFIAAYQTEGTVTGSVMSSTDGLIWESGSVSQEGYLAWSANSPDGVMIGAVGYLSGVNRSVDNGFNWTPVSQLSTAQQSNSHGLFADGRFVVVLTGSPGRVFRSTDALTWQESEMLAGINSSPVIGHIGNLYFLGRSPNFSQVSTDAITWRNMSRSLNHRKVAHARGLFVAEATNGGIVTSRDGETWSETTGLPSSVSRIIANDEIFLVIGNNGATWISRDGAVWENTMLGGVATTGNTRVGLSMAEFNGRMITAGTRILVTSSDSGRTWANATVNGLPPSSSNTFQKVVASGSEVMAIEIQGFSTTNLLRSTDGVSFSTITGLPTKSWVDLASSGSEWMLLATDGSLFRSTNGGLNWTQVAVTGMQRGAAVTWFNNRWVIIGADVAGFNAPYVGFTLGVGDVLQNHGNIGFFNSNQSVRTLVAHGRLLIWTRGENTFVTSNGSTWSASSLSAGAGNHDYDIYHTPDGFTAFKGSTVASYPVEAWSADPNGLSWASIPSPFNSIQFSENLGSRVFLFANGVISELHDKDLALTLPSLAAISLGVSDQISTNVTIRNLGRAIPAGGTWKVTAWLAKNRFYGDTKNIPLGTFDLTAAMPAPGASQSYPVSFTLPNGILTGANYLILRLSGPEDIRETNLANNTVISDTAAITIPEWSFNVVTNGNGQVNRDFAAMRYPHKAQVSLTASAGKGATFTGWSGDGYSPNNQITILMDGNKTLAANFSNRATLQVFVRGAGVVNGLAEMGSYDVGQSANLTAAPAAGWVFSHWSGDASSSQANQTVLMDQAKTITAHFRLPMASWKSQHFSTTQLADAAISGDNSDPDGDGLKNWQEYLHASHPLHAQSRGVTPHTIEAGMMRMVYTRNLGAVNGGTVFSQASRDLTQWNAPGLQERIISTVDGIETIEVRFPATAPCGYLRMHYQQTGP
jgi:subtilisin family serine protease